MTPEHLKVLTDSIEHLLSLPFPMVDNWQTGLTNWEADRRHAIDALLEKICNENEK